MADELAMWGAADLVDSPEQAKSIAFGDLGQGVVIR